MKSQMFFNGSSDQYENTVNGTRMLINEDKMNQEYEEVKQNSNKIPRRSTLGLSSFKSKTESSPFGDR